MVQRGMGKARLLLLAGALAVPFAIAASSAGEFVTRGAVDFTGTTDATFPTAVLFLGDTSQVDISGSFPLARVCLHEWRSAEIGVVSPPLFSTPIEKKGPCFDQRNLALSLTPSGNHSGWLGVHPSPGGSLAFTPNGTATLEPASSFTFASPEADTFGTDASGPDREKPDQPVFVARSAEPSVTASQAGVAVQVGPGELKIKGADVVMRSDTNESEYRTEDTSAQGSVGERVQRWLVVTFPAGEVTITSNAAPFQVAASSATVAFDGIARFVPESGGLQFGETTYPADRGEAATVDGSFSAIVTPTSGGDALGLTLRGDARSASFVQVPAPATGAAFPWLWVGVGAVALVLVGGAAVAVKRYDLRPVAAVRERIQARHHKPKPTPLPAYVGPTSPASPEPAAPESRVAIAQVAESYAERAHAAALAENWPVAVDLLERALRAHPELPDGHLDLGGALLDSGKPEEAIPVLEKAAKESETGEAEMLCAVASVKMRAEGQAEGYLLDALGRKELHPDVLAEIQERPELAKVRERPRVKAAIDAATTRLHGPP